MVYCRSRNQNTVATVTMGLSGVQLYPTGSLVGNSFPYTRYCNLSDVGFQDFGIQNGDESNRNKSHLIANAKTSQETQSALTICILLLESRLSP